MKSVAASRELLRVAPSSADGLHDARAVEQDADRVDVVRVLATNREKSCEVVLGLVLVAGDVAEHERRRDVVRLLVGADERALRPRVD